MKIDIKRIDKTLPLPSYDRESACFDFVCRESATLKPGEVKLIPSNVVVRLPKGYTLLVFARSSLPLKKGLTMSYGVGVVDPYFCGDKDEIYLQFINFSNKEVHIERGETLAQGMITKYETAEWNEVEEMGEAGDGGYWAVREEQ